jgi:hypothetical protein
MKKTEKIESESMSGSGPGRIPIGVPPINRPKVADVLMGGDPIPVARGKPTRMNMARSIPRDAGLNEHLTRAIQSGRWMLGIFRVEGGQIYGHAYQHDFPSGDFERAAEMFGGLVEKLIENASVRNDVPTSGSFDVPPAESVESIEPVEPVAPVEMPPETPAE